MKLKMNTDAGSGFLKNSFVRIIGPLWGGAVPATWYPSQMMEASSKALRFYSPSIPVV